MGSTATESVEEIDSRLVKKGKWYNNWKWITSGIVIILALILAALNYYQAKHFNANIKINGVNVGGLTSDEALNKLKSSVLKNVVYVGEKQIFDGKDTNLGFSDQDLSGVNKLLKSQQTVFPSSKEKDYSLVPNSGDPYRSQEMKN